MTTWLYCSLEPIITWPHCSLGPIICQWIWKWDIMHLVLLPLNSSTWSCGGSVINIYWVVFEQDQTLMKARPNPPSPVKECQIAVSNSLTCSQAHLRPIHTTLYIIQQGPNRLPNKAQTIFPTKRGSSVFSWPVHWEDPFKGADNSIDMFTSSPGSAWTASMNGWGRYVRSVYSALVTRYRVQ